MFDRDAIEAAVHGWQPPGVDPTGSAGPHLRRLAALTTNSFDQLSSDLARIRGSEWVLRQADQRLARPLREDSLFGLPRALERGEGAAGRPRAIPEALLIAARHPPTDLDRAEDAEIERELAGR